MIRKLKNIIRSFTPNFVLIAYHKALAHLAAFLNGYPSKKLFVIGITGTKGKTSTANFVWSVLNAAGFKTGQIGTANIRMGDRDFLNEFHMTMPSPFIIQKLLKQMVEAGCTHVVMEATSEGMKLFRHIGIGFGVAIFTNLTPEHMPSHDNDFEKYKAEKTKLFKSLKQPSISIINSDSEWGSYFGNFPASQKFTYGINSGEFQATNINDSVSGVGFQTRGKKFHLSVLGKFNLYNALPAIALGHALNLSYEKIAKGISDLKVIPGRMERIDEGQKFTVIIDYAHEKISMNAVLDTARNMAGGSKVIVLLGAEGGGRDKSKRQHMGEAAAKKADFVICSDVDPYEDDPYPIANDIAVAAEQFGKIRDQNLFVILDRREGIAKALKIAQANDIVVITGKGAEQTMIKYGKAIPWDDRLVVREELKKLLGK